MAEIKQAITSEKKESIAMKVEGLVQNAISPDFLKY